MYIFTQPQNAYLVGTPQHGLSANEVQVGVFDPTRVLSLISEETVLSRNDDWNEAFFDFLLILLFLRKVVVGDLL